MYYDFSDNEKYLTWTGIVVRVVKRPLPSIFSIESDVGGFKKIKWFFDVLESSPIKFIASIRADPSLPFESSAPISFP